MIGNSSRDHVKSDSSPFSSKSSANDSHPNQNIDGVPVENDFVLGLPSERFPDWQSVYKAVLAETDTAALFKLLEIAESSIRIRRASLEGSVDHHDERQAIDDALVNLQVMKKERLKFG